MHRMRTFSFRWIPHYNYATDTYIWLWWAWLMSEPSERVSKQRLEALRAEGQRRREEAAALKAASVRRFEDDPQVVLHRSRGIGRTWVIMGPTAASAPPDPETAAKPLTEVIRETWRTLADDERAYDRSWWGAPMGSPAPIRREDPPVVDDGQTAQDRADLC